MKNIITGIAAFLLLLTTQSSTAQVSEKVYADPGELKQMKGRTLLVALMDLDEKQITKWEKKLDKNKERIENYKNFVSTYNTLIQKVVKEHWTINTKVEYKQLKDVMALNEKKDSKYTLLVYNELGDMDWDARTLKMIVPILQYHRCEKPFRMRDYFAYLPYASNRESYNESDLIFAVEQIQKGIEFSISTNKKQNILDYYLGAAKKNCAKMKSKKVICDVTLRNPKLDDKDTVAYTGNFSFVPVSDIEKNVKEKSAKNYVTMFFPFGIMKGSMGISAMVLCCKVVFDPSTNEIIYYFEPGGMGSISDNTIREADLKRMEKCTHK